jgi:hypothetical protein
MLLGLSLLAFNVQRLLEIALTHTFLFCDCSCFGRFQLKGVKKMVIMNLEAHRMRNKMTSIIYSMSLGFIIFLIVSYKLQISATELRKLQRKGAYLSLTTIDQTLITPDSLDAALRFNEDLIEAHGFITPAMSDLPQALIDSMYAGDYARLNVEEIEVFGIQPSVFNASLDDFNVPYWTSKSKLSLGE